MKPPQSDDPNGQKKKSHRKKNHEAQSFYQLLLDRVEHFSTVAQQVLTDHESDAIHHTRVYSRRVQSAMEVLPGELIDQTKPLKKQLRRTRHALNGIRDADVFLEIIKKRIGSRKNQTPYELLRDHLQDRRKKALDKMDSRLKDLSLQEFPSRFIAAIADPETSLKIDGTTVRFELSGAARDDKAIAHSIDRVVEHWHRVQGMTDEPDTFSNGEKFHSLRIAIKRLRYIVELISQMKTVNSKALVAYLKGMQDAIGEWHDLQVLETQIIKFIGHPSFINKELESSRILHGLVSQLRHRMKTIITSVEPKLKSDRLNKLVEKFLSELNPVDISATDLNSETSNVETATAAH